LAVVLGLLLLILLLISGPALAEDGSGCCQADRQTGNEEWTSQSMHAQETNL